MNWQPTINKPVAHIREFLVLNSFDFRNVLNNDGAMV